MDSDFDVRVLMRPPKFQPSPPPPPAADSVAFDRGGEWGSGALSGDAWLDPGRGGSGSSEKTDLKIFISSGQNRMVMVRSTSIT